VRATRLAPAAVVLLVLGACADGAGDGSSAARSGSPADTASAVSPDGTACPPEGEPFDGEARLFIEYNATDEDAGVHGGIDHEGMVEACIRDPRGGDILVVRPVNRFGHLGIGEFSFESREPPVDEYSIEDLQADFPAGTYKVSGVDHEGTPRVGTALLTHDIPAPPAISEPRLADEDQASVVVLPPTGLTVRWQPVTRTLDDTELSVTGYEVIVTQAEHEDPHGQSRPEYDVHLPPDRTELAVPDGFLEPDTVYELEVLALEESGNQTITLGFFTTAG
jgi:hypothetical protein